MVHFILRIVMVLLFLAGAVLGASAAPLSPAANRPIRSHHGPPAAAGVDQSGPLPVRQTHEGPEVFSMRVPMNPRIRAYLRMYTAPAWVHWVGRVLRRARPFMGYISARIAADRLPPELVYLPIAESSYDPYAVSKVGAAGLWQLMTTTGHRHDLTINSWVDQRFDFWTATDASLATLKHDYHALGNWLLALAAYDAGLGFMKEVIAETGIHNYWTLAARGYLPAETADYVPRFLALVAICSYPGRYGVPVGWTKSVEWDRIPVDKPVDLRLLADEAKVNRRLLMEGNAGLRREVAPPHQGGGDLNVPQKDAGAVERALNQPKDNLMRFYFYPVKRGDTLFRLARYYGVPISMIEQYNAGVRPGTLLAGRLLLIPAVKNVRPYPGPHPPPKLSPKLAAEFSGSYTVHKGDTLWSIAHRYNTPPTELARVNGLTDQRLIKIGQVLRVPTG